MVEIYDKNNELFIKYTLEEFGMLIAVVGLQEVSSKYAGYCFKFTEKRGERYV